MCVSLWMSVFTVMSLTRFLQVVNNDDEPWVISSWPPRLPSDWSVDCLYGPCSRVFGTHYPCTRAVLTGHNAYTSFLDYFWTFLLTIQEHAAKTWIMSTDLIERFVSAATFAPVFVGYWVIVFCTGWAKNGATDS